MLQSIQHEFHILEVPKKTGSNQSTPAAMHGQSSNESITQVDITETR